MTDESWKRGPAAFEPEFSVGAEVRYRRDFANLQLNIGWKSVFNVGRYPTSLGIAFDRYFFIDVFEVDVVS